MLLSAENVSMTVRLRAVADGMVASIARCESSDLHEMWHNIAPKFRRRKDAA